MIKDSYTYKETLCLQRCPFRITLIILNRKKAFAPIGQFKKDTIDKVFNFSYKMCFSGEGEHRDHRTGGSYNRRNAEIFANTFQGKFTECSLYNTFVTNHIPANTPDFSVYKLGVWDAEDINININVNGIVYRSNPQKHLGIYYYLNLKISTKTLFIYQTKKHMILRF